MKKPILLLTALASIALTLASCGGETPNESSSSGIPDSSSAPISGSVDPSATSEPDPDESSSVEVTDGFKGTIRVYFHNDTGTETSYRIYAWIAGVNGVEFDWDGKEEGYGVYKDFDAQDPFFQGIAFETFFFIIKQPGTWAGQSSDTTVVLADYMDGATDLPNGGKMLHVYAAQGEGNAIDCFQKKEDANGDHFTSFNLSSDWSKLSLESTGDCASYKLYAFTPEYYNQSEMWKEKNKELFLVSQGEPGVANFDIAFADMAYPFGDPVEAKLNLTYQVEGHFASAPDKTKTKIATYDRVYDSEKFIQEYTYNGHDLGSKYSETETEFRVWSPISHHVTLLLFWDLNGKVSKDPLYRFPMHAQEGGVWSATVKGNLHNYTYAYEYKYGGGTIRAADPYATACGVNGTHSAIVDFSRTNPEGFNELSFDPVPANHLTVYEAHIRDLTAHETWTSHYGNERGTYNAFVEPGTKFNGVTTGFDHIKELGVNAVQLLPIFDQDNEERTLKITDDSGNVTYKKPSYNWGYNPMNYNCVEGAYSSDPYAPSVRIRELKNVVNELGKAGIRTVMDVVYNHVSSVTNHPFTSAMPRYYFRYDENAFLIDNTGVGNTVNTDRVMAKNFVVDSVCFWAKEYKMKGFRFDLMGCLTVETMREVKDALYEIDPDIVVYGEGWTGAGYSGKGASANTDNTYRMLQDNGKGAIGCFNDAYRDGMKGNTTWSNVTPSGGFMTGNAGDNWRASVGVIGQNHNVASQGVATPANSTVDYIACHDNYTLYDQFNYLLNGQGRSGNGYAENAVKGVVASSTHSFFGQGIAFINGGDEIMRTKIMRRGDPQFDELVASYKHATNGKDSWIEGDGVRINDDTWLVRNSYKYGDNVNAFDWSRKIAFKGAYDSIREALKFRNENMDKIFGQTQAEINAGKTVCLADSAIGGTFEAQDGGKYILLTSARRAGNVAKVPAAYCGNYEVAYCSSGRLAPGSAYSVDANVGIAEAHETLILRKK